MKYPGSPVGSDGGSKAAVTAVQARLEAAGCGPVAVDGVWGPETEAALRLFQARGRDANGQPLEIDGIVGPMTWAALFGQAVARTPPPRDGLIHEMLAVAASQVGVLETPPGSNRGPEVDAYLKAAGLDAWKGSYAWCAAFVFWCFREAAGRLSDRGTPTINPAPRQAGVHNMWREAGAKSLARFTARQIAKAPELVRPGMLFFLDAGAGKGHVGIIERVAGVVLTTIEGNASPAGSREGIGVFRLTKRRVGQINLGVADFTRTQSTVARPPAAPAPRKPGG